MFNKLKKAYSGLRAVVKYEGVKSLISRGYTHLLHRSIVFEKYYVVCADIKNAGKDREADFLPKTDNFCYKIISTNREADELTADGFHLASYEFNLRASLDKDVVVFCIFIGKELAHIVCLANNIRGKATVDPRPFSIDFQHGEVVTGKALTIPKFRRLRLRNYSAYLLRMYCLERDITRIKGTMLVNNYAALGAASLHGYMTIISECRLVRIFWIKHYKCKQTELTTPKQVIVRNTDHSDKKIDKEN